ncbi:MAG: hypothetical protein DRN60_04610 [Thaumarchaeota archaeon]|nr:MAG: hypothetical protein DRN60_04610 [Nitrososphaerota archaeon]
MKGLTIEEAVRFHGHRGPFLILGYRAGKIAVKNLGAKLSIDSLHKLRAVVYCPMRVPYTCFIDGVQCSTGCTAGKLNLHIVEKDKIVLRLEDKERGKSVEVHVNSDILPRILTMEMEEASKWALEAGIEEIFKIRVR